jgi:hypothetical protein
VQRIENGHETRRCSKCREFLPLSEFSVKSKRTGQLWSMCDDCRRVYQRERYLHVAKVEALNAARLVFRWTESDEVELVCGECGQPIVDGDLVVGQAELDHARCRGIDESELVDEERAAL